MKLKKHFKMEDKKLTPQESMELIASMIQTSKQRVAMPDLRISVIWAVVTILTAIAAWALLITTHNPWCNFVWLAIPVIGLPANVILEMKARHKSRAITYIDKVKSGIWSTVGYIALGLTAGCFIAQLCGYPQAWQAMLIYAFVVVGFGAAATGLLLKEPSYIVGGIFSIFSGFALTICLICQIPLLYVWVVPLYILCFLLMFIVPAFVIARKLKNENR